MADIDALDVEWSDTLRSQLEWVDGWITPGSEPKFTGPLGRCSLIALILDSGTIPPDETSKLQALGTYLGQAIAEETGWSWCVFSDEHGSDLALKFADPDGVLFPSTMISKRVERGEAIDVGFLFEGVISAARDAKAKMGS